MISHTSCTGTLVSHSHASAHVSAHAYSSRLSGWRIYRTRRMSTNFHPCVRSCGAPGFSRARTFSHIQHTYNALHQSAALSYEPPVNFSFQTFYHSVCTCKISHWAVTSSRWFYSVPRPVHTPVRPLHSWTLDRDDPCWTCGSGGRCFPWRIHRMLGTDATRPVAAQSLS